MADKQQGRWITINEAVSYFDRSERTLRRWIKAGTIRSKRVKNRVYVVVYDTKADIEPDMSAAEPDTSAIVVLEAEVKRLTDLLDQANADRDYLRQAHAAALSKIPAIEAHASEPPRRWWQFWK
jgi:hypothetical protein